MNILVIWNYKNPWVSNIPPSSPKGEHRVKTERKIPNRFCGDTEKVLATLAAAALKRKGLTETPRTGRTGHWAGG